MAAKVTTPADRAETSRMWLAVACVAVFACAVAFRLGILSSALFFDEYYHILAAQGLLETGEPRIGDGTYSRVYAYTWFISKIFALAGNEIQAARLSSVFAASGLIVIAFLWMRARAGWTAALTATALAILSPIGIETAIGIRFYVWQGVAFFLFAVFAYSALVDAMGSGRRAVTAALAALALMAALYLQPLSSAGVLGVGLWWGIFMFLPWASRQAAGRWIILGAIGLVLAGLAAAFALGIVGEAWKQIRFAPDWAASVKNSQGYYHRILLGQYGVLWPAFPLALVLAAARHPRPATFLGTVFVVSLAVLSVAGMKSLRYIYFVMPFLFGVYGIAFAAVAAPAWKALVSACGKAGKALFGRPLARPLAVLGALVALLFLAIGNGAFLKSLRMARGIHQPTEHGDWLGAEPLLRRIVTDDMIVATPRELQAFYHIGRADVTVSVSRLSELGGRGDFGIDPRTGLPTVGTAEGAAHLVACTRHGFFIVPSNVETWIRPIFPDPGTYSGPAVLTRVPELAPFGFDAVIWETRGLAPDCGDLPEKLRRG